MRVLQTELRLNILFILRPEEVCRISLCMRVCACVIPPARTSLKLPLRDTSSKWKRAASFHKYGNKPAGTSRGKRTSSAQTPNICVLLMLLTHYLEISRPHAHTHTHTQTRIRPDTNKHNQQLSDQLILISSKANNGT